MSMPEPEVHKRPRDELTERLIQEALEDEARRKREKKGLPPPGTGPGERRVCVCTHARLSKGLIPGAGSARRLRVPGGAGRGRARRLRAPGGTGRGRVRPAPAARRRGRRLPPAPLRPLKNNFHPRPHCSHHQEDPQGQDPG